MGLVIPPKYELLYDVVPNVLPSDVKTQSKLVQLVKKKAGARAVRGEPLDFRIDVDGLFEIAVQPGTAAVFPPGAFTNGDIVVRRKNSHNGSTTPKHIEQLLLSEETIYPSDVWQQRYDNLVGLDQIKDRVLTMLRILFSEGIVTEWLRKHHPRMVQSSILEKPYPVLVFAGVPGLGKTELARSIGDPLARELGTQVVQYRVGLQVRGEGLVGQLSQNIFKLIEFAKTRHQELGVPILLLVDEADAIGQSRTIKEQHQEERAGLNTLLQQIDSLRDTPGVAMILTTNLPDVLDKALKERSSAHWITFPTPTGDDRQQLLKCKLGTILQRREFQSIAAATAGYSPRSIVELIRRAVIEAISLDCPLTKDLLLRAASSGGLTQAFQSNGRGFYRRTPSPGSRKRRPKHAPAQRHKSVYATAVE